MIQMTSKPVEFSPKKKYENEERFAAKWRNCGWSGTTTTTQKARNRNAKNNRDEKCEDRTVLKCLFTMARTCRNVARGCVAFQRRDYQL
jgi:hypothetical protein